MAYENAGHPWMLDPEKLEAALIECGATITGCCTDNIVTTTANNPESYRVLAISTEHLEISDKEVLDNLARGDEGMVFERDTGYFVNLYEEEYNLHPDYSESLKSLICRALTNGYRMIEFDSDAPAIII